MNRKILIPVGAGAVLLSAFIAWLLLFFLKSPKEEPPPACTETPEIVKFTASPQTIEKGESSTLEWEVKNSDFVQIDQEIGEVEATGSREVSPTSKTTYALTARCGEEEATKEAILSVKKEFKVEAVTASVDPTSKTTTNCTQPITFTFSGRIRANRDGTVTYQWEKPDGTLSSKKTLKFSKAETKTVKTTWAVYVGASGWQRLKILSPNELTSNKASFSTSCKFAVTKVTVSYSLENLGSTVCTIANARVVLSGNITASKAGTVKYHWIIGLTGPGTSFTDSSPTESIKFDKADTKTVGTTIDIGSFYLYADPGTYTGTLKLKVTSPNSIQSSTKTYTHTFTDCP